MHRESSCKVIAGGDNCHSRICLKATIKSIAPTVFFATLQRFYDELNGLLEQYGVFAESFREV